MRRGLLERFAGVLRRGLLERFARVLLRVGLRIRLHRLVYVLHMYFVGQSVLVRHVPANGAYLPTLVLRGPGLLFLRSGLRLRLPVGNRLHRLVSVLHAAFLGQSRSILQVVLKGRRRVTLDGERERDAPPRVRVGLRIRLHRLVLVLHMYFEGQSELVRHVPCNGTYLPLTLRGRGLLFLRRGLRLRRPAGKRLHRLVSVLHAAFLGQSLSYLHVLRRGRRRLVVVLRRGLAERLRTTLRGRRTGLRGLGRDGPARRYAGA